MPAPTGAHTELWYYWEEDASGNPDFATDSTDDTDSKPFGGNATLSQFEGSNNAVDVFEPNSREMAQLIAQAFDGAATIDFEWTNPWWLQAVISKVTNTTDNGDGTFTHEFNGDIPMPIKIYAGYDSRAVADGNDPGYRILDGFVAQSATTDVSVEGNAEVSLNGAYVNEEWVTQASLDGQPPLQHDVLTFAEAMLSLDSSTLSLVQDASVEINNNTDIIREIGTRFGVDYSPKARVPSVEFTKIREDNSQVEDMYGSQAATSVEQNVNSNDPMTYTVDNGSSAGSGQNKVDISMDGAFPESVGTQNLGDPQEDLQESINRRLRTVDATATNEVSQPR